GLTSLGGLTGSTQTFAVGSAGTAPAISSATSTHTLNIPMASTAAVTAGLLSKTDYDAFTAKQAAFTTSAGLLGILSDETGTGFAVFSASPTFTGVPLAPTAAVSTNTTQIATTAFVLGQVATVAPLIDGTAAVGTSLLYARQDHVHPTDTTRAPAAGSASVTTLGTITTGTWNGTAIDIAHGGTGATTQAAAQTALGITSAGLTATGNLAGNIPLVGTGGIVANNLCAGASSGGGVSCSVANTSAGLAGLITDETGSGLLVFGTSPTILNPVIANIAPAANFTLTQNTNVVPFTSVNTGAVANTLYLNAGRVGVGKTTLQAKLDVNGSISGGGRYFYSENYALVAGTPTTINLLEGVNTLQVGYHYRIKLALQGTGTSNGSVYIIYRTAVNTWVTSLVSANAVSSFVPVLQISGSNVQISMGNGYTVQALIEGFFDGNVDGPANTALFGIESVMTNLGGNIGIGTTAPGQKLEVAGAVKASSFMSGTAAYILPATDSTSGYVLSTNGAGTLSWVANGSGSAPLASPTFTGVPAAPTAAVNTNTTQIATTAFVLGQTSTKENTITAGTTAQYLRGDKSLSTFASDIWATVLTGLSTATNSAITAADSILIAFGKLQAQVTSLTSNGANYLVKNGSDTISGTISLTNVITATGAGDIIVNSTPLGMTSAVNKAYADLKLPLTGGTMTGALVNNTSSAGAAVEVTQSGAGYAATFMGGNVGIGATAPTAKLEVVGQSRSISSAGGGAKTNASANIDWNNGNTQTMSVDCATTAFTNMLDGGTYLLAVTETGTTTCVYSQAGLTFYYNPANGARTSGQRTVYSYQRIGTDVYVSWIAGFQ
ncbi:MAG: hypothetical protein PHY93_18930, partial [Bacteriovorax sp.]|nr:hypothetical protein [Bacteriovorax sp.]